MKNNQRKLVRFLSEQYQNYGYMGDDDDNATKTLAVATLKIPKKNILHRISVEAERKIDESEREVQLVSEILQPPTFTRVTSIIEDEEINQHTNIIIEPVSPHIALETGMIDIAKQSGSQRLRWNLLFNLLLWVIVPLPFWIPFISNKVALYLLPIMQGVFVIIWIIIAILAMKNALILYMKQSHNYAKKIHSLEMKRIRHIVAISCYKEPVELISTSIQTVANQSEVHRITMVISFEEKTPEKEEKCIYLQNRFKDVGFERIIFTIHPRGLPNEIPGKCSNSNYGLRMAVNQMNITDDDDHMKNILVTTCDADSKFPPEYIAALTWKYLEENQPALTTIYWLVKKFLSFFSYFPRTVQKVLEISILTS